VLAVAVAAGAHPTPPRGNGSEGGSTGRRRRRGSSSGAPVPLSLSPSLSLSVSPVAAAVGDRPVAAVVEGRRRPRRWGGVCGVCVSVHDLREKRLSVECFCLPSA